MGKYKQLTYKERCQIESFLHAGYKQSEIAKTLGRSKSTIHTELNRLQCNQVGYNADDAQHDSDQKKLTQRRCSRKLTEHKWLEIERLLKEEWSPEQISGWLEENGLQSVSHEWIYQYIWINRTEALCIKACVIKVVNITSAEPAAKRSEAELKTALALR